MALPLARIGDFPGGDSTAGGGGGGGRGGRGGEGGEGGGGGGRGGGGRGGGGEGGGGGRKGVCWSSRVLSAGTGPTAGSSRVRFCSLSLSLLN